MAAPPSLPALPCPDCTLSRDKDRAKGKRRIGNNRSICPTCNAFTREVARRMLKRLRLEDPDEFRRIRLIVEADLYPSYVSRWAADHPVPEDQYRASAILTAEVDDALRQLAEGLGVEP